MNPAEVDQENYRRAVLHVTTTRNATIQGLQLAGRFSYNGAAEFLERMEKEGVVGPVRPDGTREVLK